MANFMSFFTFFLHIGIYKENMKCKTRNFHPNVGMVVHSACCFFIETASQPTIPFRSILLKTKVIQCCKAKIETSAVWCLARHGIDGKCK